MHIWSRKGFVLQRRATAFLIRHERYDVMQAEVVLNDHAKTRQLTPAVRGIVRRYAKVELGKIRRAMEQRKRTPGILAVVLFLFWSTPVPLAKKARIGS